MAVNQEKLLETIGGMTVLELSEFVDAFKEKFNVTAAVAAPVAMAGIGTGYVMADRFQFGRPRTGGVRFEGDDWWSFDRPGVEPSGSR